MKYLCVRNWRKFQANKHRNPPWIKFHSRLLSDPDIDKLSDRAKLTLHQVWLLVAAEGDTEGRIPAWKVTRESLKMQTKPALAEIQKAGYVVIVPVNNSVNNFPLNTLESISPMEGDTGEPGQNAGLIQPPPWQPHDIEPCADSLCRVMCPNLPRPHCKLCHDYGLHHVAGKKESA